MPIRSILDLAEEELALRAGILITDHDLFQLLAGTPMEGWAARLAGDTEEVIGIRPEFFEDITRVLRAAVGNLPDASPAIVKRLEYIRQLQKRGVNPVPIMEAFNAELDTGKYTIIGEEVIQAVTARTGAAREDVNVVFLMIAESMDRSASVLLGNVRTPEWDGRVPLADLFQTESIPRDDSALLDQRYIDFLAAQPDKLQEIHWRNFERLTGEFFDRQGYEVKLGPGTKDGGIDVRVWPKGGTAGPPLIVIQCKRYDNSRLVALENVKALWADVVFEKAQRGLIATTSRVTPAGKRIVAVRQYPLDLAESDKVKEWVNTMWRLSWTGTGKTVGVGVYPLPPFYPIRKGDLDFLEEDSKPTSKAQATPKKPRGRKRRRK